MARELWESSSSENSEESTTEPSVVSPSNRSSGSDIAVMPAADLSDQVANVFAGGLSYDAQEGALLCGYADDTVTVPLVGWSREDVETIVQGLTTGDWSSFVQVTEEVPDSRDSPGSSTDPPPASARRWRGVRGLQGFFEGGRGLLWSLFVLWFLVQGVRAQAAVDEFGIVLRDPQGLSSCRGLAVQVQECSGVAALPNGREGCDGSVFWKVCKAVILIGTWEIGRCCTACCRRIRSTSKEAASQTCDVNLVPLPLVKGVPNRSEILFSLWKAGYKVDADASEYSEGVRTRFHGHKDSYLHRLEVDGVGFSENSSSDTPESDAAPQEEG